MSPTTLVNEASLLRTCTVAQVVDEYTTSCGLPQPFARARWGSDEAMRNRHRLAVSVVDLHRVHRWLDVGCGDAALFAAAEQRGHRVDHLVGIDVTPAMIEAARRRPLAGKARFRCGDLIGLERDDEHGPFDLVTAIGVLQRCGHPPDRVITTLAATLREGGRLLLTTKHVGWRPLALRLLEPEPGHSWFALPELHAWIEAAGLAVERVGGFLPREHRVVEPPETHTVFVIARRPGGERPLQEIRP